MSEVTSDELVSALLVAAERGKQGHGWWITKFGTVLIGQPDVVLWVGGGRGRFFLGAGMPPVFGPDDIAEISISDRDKDLLWAEHEAVTRAQEGLRREKALASFREGFNHSPAAREGV